MYHCIVQLAYTGIHDKLVFKLKCFVFTAALYMFDFEGGYKAGVI